VIDFAALQLVLSVLIGWPRERTDGHAALREIATVATPDTLLRWHRHLASSGPVSDQDDEPHATPSSARWVAQFL
jgi:hypothetical protein